MLLASSLVLPFLHSSWAINLRPSSIHSRQSLFAPFLSPSTQQKATQLFTTEPSCEENRRDSSRCGEKHEEGRGLVNSVSFANRLQIQLVRHSHTVQYLAVLLHLRASLPPLSSLLREGTRPNWCPLGHEVIRSRVSTQSKTIIGEGAWLMYMEWREGKMEWVGAD